jgi:hypothetical protein
MAVLKKLPGAATSLIAFAPWILYGFASGFNHWRIAAGGGLILWLVSAATAQSRGASIKLMDLTALTFFAIASVLAIGLRASWFPTCNAVIVWSCFAIAAWSSVAVGRPFTASYARENAPPEFWSNPIFIRLNLLMTLVWCGLMTVNLLLAATGVMVGGLFGQVVLGIAIPMAVLVAGFIFNGRFPRHYLAQAGFQGDVASPTATSA